MLRCLIASLGKDAPGGNACIRAVTRLANHRDIEVYGAKQGFRGIQGRQFWKLRENDVGHILARGSSILGSSHFVGADAELPQVAESLKKFDLVVAMGGVGSFSILHRLYSRQDLGLTTTMFVPASVEGEFLDPKRFADPETEYKGVHAESIGMDTAANTAVEAIDRLRDQSRHQRTVFLVECVGEKSNCLPLQIGLAIGAHRMYLPRYPILDDENREEIKKLFGEGFDPNVVDVRELVAWIHRMFEGDQRKSLVVTIPSGIPMMHRSGTITDRTLPEDDEGVTYEELVTTMAPLELTTLRVVDNLMLAFGASEEIQVRHVLLDDLQRGGSPTSRDRLLGSMYGEAAVEEFLAAYNWQGADRRGNLNLIAIEDLSSVGWKCHPRSEVAHLFEGARPRAGGLDPMPFLRQSRGIVTGYRPMATL